MKKDGPQLLGYIIIICFLIQSLDNVIAQVPGIWKGGLPAKTQSATILLPDPSKPGVIYTGVFESGVYKTTNLGVEWVQAKAPLNNKLIKAMLIHNNVIYAGAGIGLYKSSDGITWQLANAPMNIIGVQSIADVNGEIFVGSGYDGRDYNSGIYKSNDGVNWIKTNASFNRFESINCFLSINATIYAGTSEGIYRTTDRFNWQKVSIPSIARKEISALIQNKGIIIAAARDGIFRSKDGLAWEYIDVVKVNAPKRVNTFLVVNEVIYAGTDNGVYSSTDGLTWIRGTISQNVMVVAALFEKNGVIYAATGFGLFRSDDGATWHDVNPPLEFRLDNNTGVYAIKDQGGYLFAGTARGVYKSVDGWNWIEANNGLEIGISTLTLLVRELNPNIVIAGAKEGIFRSTDGGLNWDRATGPSFDTPLFLSAKGALYAGTRQEGIFRSTDGLNWTFLTGTKTFLFYALIEHKGIIYAANDQDVIYFSVDGLNWQKATWPFNSKGVKSLVAFRDRLYAGTFSDGFIESLDGYNWVKTNSPVMRDKAVDIFFIANGSLYAAVNNYAISDFSAFRTTNGNDWVPVSGSINKKVINAFAIKNGTIYVGAGDGIHKSENGLDFSLTALFRKSITALISTDEVLYAGTNNGEVFKSYDGIKWYPIVSGFQTLSYISTLNYIESTNRLYAGTLSGVYLQDVDKISPTLPTIRINGGAKYSPSKNVTLELIVQGVTAGFDSMKIGMQSDLSDAQWEIYNPNVFFILSGNDGAKNVYVKLKDLSWNESAIGNTQIILDTTSPTTPIAGASQVVLGQPNKRILFWAKSTDTTSGMDRYRIHLSQTKNFSGVTTTRDSVFASENPSYTTSILADAKWYWRVTAVDRAGNESVSPADSFVVNVGQAPAAPVIQLPVPITSNNTPTISWTQVDGAESYRLQYAVSANFANATTISDLSVPNYIFTQALPDGLFSFRVYAKNASGIESVASPTAQLSIDTRAPQNPVLEIAAGAAYIKTANVVLRLSATGADSVRLLGDLANTDLTRFQFFDLGNPIHTQVNVNLRPEDGLKNLQAQFKDRAGNIVTAFRSIFLDTQLPVFPSGSPQLSVVTPSLNQAVAVSLAAPTDGNGSGIKSFVLYYRRAGENWENQNKAAFQNNLVQIPSPFITNRGVDYQIVAEDSAGNNQPLRNGNLNFFSIPVSIRAGEVGSSPGLPGGTSGSAYRLISLPLIVENQAVSTIFTDLGTYGIDKDYFFWRYEGGNTWREGANIPVQPGESYFLIRRKSGSLSNKSAGTTAKATDADLGNIIGWQLRANDWTLIGNLFNFEISLIDLRLKNRDTSLVFIPDVWSYDGGSLNKGWTKQNLRLSPWAGLAVYNASATDTLIFTPSTSPASIATTPLARSFDESFSRDEWRAQIRAESRGLQDNENYIGLRKEAQASQDEFDLYEPPLVPGGVSLSFTTNNSEPKRSLAADIRPLNEAGYEWILQIKGVGGSEVKLDFEELATLPTETKIYLLDRSSRLLRDLRKQSEIVVYLPQSTATKTLTILLGDKSFVEKHSAGLSAVPSSFALHQNYPNPFNPTTVIRYELPVAGKVTLKIYNLLGTEVTTLENDEPRDVGFYERVVDLRQFAAGIYFYRIEVRGEKRFEATKKMVFTK